MRKVAVLMIPPLLGACAGAAAAKWFLPDVPKADLPWLLGLMAPSLLLVLAFHELGHLLGGSLAGFAWRLFAVGPLLLIWQDGRTLVQYNKHVSMWGGFASALPNNWSAGFDWLKRGMLLVVAGGPIASAVLALAAGAGSLLLPSPLSVFCALTALFSTAIAIATMLPNTLGGMPSDGKRWLMLLRGGPEAERWCALGLLIALDLAGKPPREWPEDLVARATGAEDGSCDHLSGRILRAQSEWHRGRLDGIEADLSYVVDRSEKLPAMLRESYAQILRIWRAFRSEDREALQAEVKEMSRESRWLRTGTLTFYQNLAAD